ncbi:MAG: PTS glucose transporter subunit IIA [Rothia sp. (in: high G+C Gram-positive bacteria)]|nr:PTS glucose transporter subunit IIA [Rothia sp. (in: high G+C Gram-positive bacteria)]
MGFKSMAGRLFGKDKQDASVENTSSAASTSAVSGVTKVLGAHMSGTVVELSKVDDPTFATGALGPGAAIEPSVGKLVAPADGKITVAFPTGHAVGLRTEDGLEILMHVGFDTVELDGKFFNPVVTKGQEVKRGDVLVEFDTEGIKAAGYPLTTPLVITNAKRAVQNTTLSENASSQSTINAQEDFLVIQLTPNAE